MKIGTSIATSIPLAFALYALPAAAEDLAAPPLVQQLNNGNWLPQAEAESLRDELFYQRAVFAYMTMLPALNVIGIRDGSEATWKLFPRIKPEWRKPQGLIFGKRCGCTQNLGPTARRRAGYDGESDLWQRARDLKLRLRTS